MASATEAPVQVPIGIDTNHNDESAPLLGEPGDVLQHQGESLVANLYRGTAWLAQAGSLLLVALVWSGVFLHPPLLPLFSPHPLLQSAGVFVIIQAILILQPTNANAAADKARGARVHAVLQFLSFAILTSGVAIIEANKIRSHGVHFHSAHGHLGVLTAVVLVGQYIFGLLIWAAPAWIFGQDRVDRAKALWKNHRWVGYVAVLPLLLATVTTATATDYNVNVLDIRLWAVLVASGLIVVGVYPRIHIRKLGLRQ